MKRCFFLYVILTLLSVIPWSVPAEEELDFNEDDIFSMDNIISESNDVVTDDISYDKETTAVTFSGIIGATYGLGISRSFIFEGADFFTNNLSASLFANFYLDVRLQNNIKSCIDLGIGYTPLLNALVINLDEFFIDVNAGKRIYFRLGKQVLKWGPGYFWNPVDFVNLEKKTLQNLDTGRGGSSGLKIHVPFGTILNFYSYLKMGTSPELASVEYSNKLECLIRNTEFSVSAWLKKDYLPILGFDLVTSLLGFSLWTEISFSYGSDTPLYDGIAGEYFIESEPVFKGCAGFSRSFDLSGRKNLFSLTCEFYYNQLGYAENMLTDPAFIPGNYYFPNDYGRYYFAGFLAFNQLFGESSRQYINTIVNLSDFSFIVSAGWNQSLLDRFSLNWGITGYGGAADTEYTLAGTLLSTEITLSLRF